MIARPALTPLAAIVLSLLYSTSPAAAETDARGDARAPTQALADPSEGPARSSRARPGERAFGVSADSIGPAFGRYELRLELGPRRVSRWLSVSAALGWYRGDFELGGSGDQVSEEASAVVTELAEGPGLGLGLALHPLGRGLDGLFFGVAVEGRALLLAEATPLDLALAGEIGWRLVWRGSAIALAAGVRHRWRALPEVPGGLAATRGALEPIIRLDVGFAL